MFLEHVLKSHNKSLDTEEKILIVNRTRGDIRSLLNSVQGKVAGYNVMREDIFEMDIAGAINGYFSSNSPQEAKAFRHMLMQLIETHTLGCHPMKDERTRSTLSSQV